jgi:hypothetical protein
MTTQLIYQLIGSFFGGTCCMFLVIIILVGYSACRAGGEADDLALKIYEHQWEERSGLFVDKK